MTPHSFFPPDPTRIPDYIAAGFELGVNFAQALVEVILNFVTDIGTFIV